jgi:hypothetical protein
VLRRRETGNCGEEPTEDGPRHEGSAIAPIW